MNRSVNQPHLASTMSKSATPSIHVDIPLRTAPALLCLLALPAYADNTKQATWTVASGGNGHTFRVVAKSGLISWDAANTEALAAGGYLATITSAEENNFVFTLIDDPTYWTQSSNDHGPWIGGYQLANASEPAGGFTWVIQTGASTPELFSYANWESGEPNNLTNTISGTNYNQDRVSFFHAGTGRAATWSDEYNLTGSGLNQWTKSYVIELEPTPPVLANPTIQPDRSFTFAFTNTPGVPFHVLMATNLPSTNWTDLGSATEISPGHFQFTDSQTSNSFSRFYRVISQ
ncbi:C-type lectin domain protein [Pedosphaera parvula Ellin514]|uniref:C-type lectin domain protein n=2 Tax=Pedosphaera TaxID=1032526 RepID=B9XMK4_PEDPL|nr:C-type lectin domain protein [Pedosphaera parvula Ellin514]